jgi:hypothetical protein
MAEDLGVRSDRKAHRDLGVTVARLSRVRRAELGLEAAAVWEEGTGGAAVAN